jgi:hypothetical protein
MNYAHLKQHPMPPQILGEKQRVVMVAAAAEPLSPKLIEPLVGPQLVPRKGAYQSMVPTNTE